MRFRRSPVKPKRRARPVHAPRRALSPAQPTWQFASLSPHHTDRLGRAIGSALVGGETLALFGPLGAGKTALVRGIAEGLDAPVSAVSSPTFVLVHEYRGRVPLAHVDLYRLTSTREIESIGLEEYLTGPTVAAIEWADKGRAILPSDRLEIVLRHDAVGSRTIQLIATGPISTGLLKRTKRHHARLARANSRRRSRETKKTAP